MRTGNKEQGSIGIFVFMLILIIGLIMGTLLIKMADTTQQGILNTITSSFINERASHSFVENFCSSLFSTSVFLLVAFFIGYFALGKPIALFIPMFKGLGLGISMADIFMQNGLKGYLICLALILPNALISSFAIVLASRESARNSSKIFSFVCGKSKEDEGGIHSGAYIIKFTVFFGLSLIGALADAGLTKLLAGVI